mgnify:CR=1 FL=1
MSPAMSAAIVLTVLCVNFIGDGLRDAFVIRYALGEQESLRIHHDVAQVSASVIFQRSRKA